MVWGKGLRRTIEAKSADGGYAQLSLTKRDRILLISSKLSKKDISVIKGDNSIGVVIQTWISNGTTSIAPKNSNLYRPPTLAQMLYMDRSILVPILDILATKEAQKDSDWLKHQLEPIEISANILNYHLIWYQERISGNSYLVLYEMGDKRRYWGTYIFKISSAKPIMVQIPHPIYEAYTLEYGLELFEAIDAKAMLISGANPMANSDRSADVLLPKNKENIFNLVSQVLFRESGTNSMNAISIRGKSSLEINQSPKAILAYDNGLTKSVGLNKTQQYFTKYLSQNIDLMIYDGTKLTAGYSADAFQSRYLEESLNNTFNVLWLPFNMRYEYKRASVNSAILAQMQNLGVDIIENIDLVDYTKRLDFSDNCIKRDTIDTLMHYLAVRDINDIIVLSRDSEIELQILLTKSNRPYILVLDRYGKLFAIVKLYSIPPYKIAHSIDRSKSLSELLHFPMSNYAILEFSGICRD